jgi:hypothetical protein
MPKLFRGLLSTLWCGPLLKVALELRGVRWALAAADGVRLGRWVAVGEEGGRPLVKVGPTSVLMAVGLAEDGLRGVVEVLCRATACVPLGDMTAAAPGAWVVMLSGARALGVATDGGEAGVLLGLMAATSSGRMVLMSPLDRGDGSCMRMASDSTWAARSISSCT